MFNIALEITLHEVFGFLQFKNYFYLLKFTFVPEIMYQNSAHL